MTTTGNKYKILLVHNFYQKPGGEDTVFYNEKKLLEQHGHEVVVYTRNNSEIKNTFHKILLPFITIFNFKTYFDIKKIIKTQKIDIVHVHNTLCLISPSVFYAALSAKVPVVQTLHNFRMQCPNGLFFRDNHICEDCACGKLASALKNKCYRNSFFQTLAVVLMLKIHRLTGIYKKINFICLTEFNKNKLLLLNKDKKIIDGNKIFVKPNFVFDTSSPENKNNKQSKSHDEEYYLYVGRLDYIKGIDIVLDAFSKMPDKTVHIIGSGKEKYENSYSKHPNIKFLGQLSPSEVESEMSSAKALIFASRWYEGQPMTIIEAYKSSLPIISCDIGNANDLIIEGSTGMHFKNDESNSLIDIVDKFNFVDIRQFEAGSRKEYENKYIDSIGYKKIDVMYSQILNH